MIKYEHQIMHNRLESSYVNVVIIKLINLHMNCGITTVVMGIILSIWVSTPQSIIDERLSKIQAGVCFDFSCWLAICITQLDFNYIAKHGAMHQISLDVTILASCKIITNIQLCKFQHTIVTIQLHNYHNRQLYRHVVSGTMNTNS